MRKLAILVPLVLFACGNAAPDPGTTPEPAPAAAAVETTAPAGSRTDIDVVTFHDKLEEGGITVIDVRTPEEYAGGHVPGAVPMPLDAIDLTAPVLAEHDKSEPLYLVCQSGRRSGIAADQLAKAGYTTVNVEGGTAAWKGKGYPVE